MLRRVFHYFFDLLQTGERRQFVWLIALAIGGMVLDTLAIGLLLPLMTLVLNHGSLPVNSPRWEKLFFFLHYPEREQLLIGALVVVGMAFVGKNFFQYYRNRKQVIFFTNLNCQLSDLLFTHYLHLPYLTHLQRHSGELNTRLGEITGFTSALQAFFVILTESLLLGGISALLLYVEFWATLSAGLLISGALLIFNFSLRRRIAKLGNENFQHNIAIGRCSLQGLNGVKEIKLLGRETFFIRQRAQHSEQLRTITRQYQTLLPVPALMLEVLGIVTLAAVVLIMIYQHKPGVVPTLGLYAAAMFRFLPAVNRIIGNLQTVQFLSAAVVNLHQEITEAKAAMKSRAARLAPKITPPLARALELRGISFCYPQRDYPAVADISLKIPAGSAVGFIGGSGAGKSTLIDLVVGLFTPTAGEILIDGQPLTAPEEWRKQIGYVPQFIYLLDDTVRRNLAFGLPDSEIDEAAIQRAITAAQLEQLVGELPQGLDTMIGERGVRLSGGQRQRLGIARALYYSPSVLVLDEATSALDLATEREILATFQNLRGKITTISIAHRFNTVAHCDLIFKLDKGKLVASGTPAEMLQIP